MQEFAPEASDIDHVGAVSRLQASAGLRALPAGCRWSVSRPCSYVVGRLRSGRGGPRGPRASYPTIPTLPRLSLRFPPASAMPGRKYQIPNRPELAVELPLFLFCPCSLRVVGVNALTMRGSEATYATVRFTRIEVVSCAAPRHLCIMSLAAKR